MDITKLQQSFDTFKLSLGKALIFSDIFTADGLSLLSHNLFDDASFDDAKDANLNHQAISVALFSEVSAKLKKTLDYSGFPSLGRYYLLKLQDQKLFGVMRAPITSGLALQQLDATLAKNDIEDDIMWSFLLDMRYVNLGLFYSIILPKALASLREALAEDLA
ncbi:MAG: hypothetical protein R2880_10050 [Deinococcales bacterium]